MENREKKVFQNIGSGILWKNKYKKTDRAPFFRGKATIRGHELEVAAWLKKDKNNQDMISMAFDDVIEEELGKILIKLNRLRGLNVTEDEIYQRGGAVRRPKRKLKRRRR